MLHLTTVLPFLASFLVIINWKYMIDHDNERREKDVKIEPNPKEKKAKTQ
jgi:hypothetical protein